MARDQSRPGAYRRLASSHEFSPYDLRGIPGTDDDADEALTEDLVALEAVEEHPADDEADSGMFRAMTEDFIQRTCSRPPSAPPVASFATSPELAALNATQDEARQHMKNILLLTKPPEFDE
jgi:hypothetical protein